MIQEGYCQKIWSKSVFELSAVKICLLERPKIHIHVITSCPRSLFWHVSVLAKSTGTQNACRIGRGLQRQNFFYQKISVWGKKRKLINYNKHSRLSHYRADILNKNINYFICINRICSILFRISQRN